MSGTPTGPDRGGAPGWEIDRRAVAQARRAAGRAQQALEHARRTAARAGRHIDDADPATADAIRIAVDQARTAADQARIAVEQAHWAIDPVRAAVTGVEWHRQALARSLQPLRGVLTGARLQLLFYFAYPDSLLPLLTAPLYTVIFVLIVRSGGRSDLSAYAVVAPVFIALWWFALYHGGNVVQVDRITQTLELQAAAPTAYGFVVFGRIITVTSIGLLSFAEVFGVGRFLLGAPVAVHHPWLLVAALLATAFAVSATALVMGGLFVLVRNGFSIANSVSFPFYVLGGIMVPVTLLPAWVQPLSKVVFLSWSADLLRSSLSAAPVTEPLFRLGMVLLLGSVSLVAGLELMRRVLRRVRANGEMGLR
jgi:ABC-2 type transport system permease protein